MDYRSKYNKLLFSAKADYKEIKKINTTSSKETIDLSNEHSGMYIVQTTSNKGFKTFKIVKE